MLFNHGKSKWLKYKHNFPFGKLRMLDDFFPLAMLISSFARETFTGNMQLHQIDWARPGISIEVDGRRG